MYTEKVKSLQVQTGNGHVIRDGAVAVSKEIVKLEKKVLMARNKLSLARSENSLLVKKINDRRKDKVLLLKIFHDTVRIR